MLLLEALHELHRPVDVGVLGDAQRAHVLLAGERKQVVELRGRRRAALSALVTRHEEERRREIGARPAQGHARLRVRPREATRGHARPHLPVARARKELRVLREAPLDELGVDLHASAEHRALSGGCLRRINRRRRARPRTSRPRINVLSTFVGGRAVAKRRMASSQSDLCSVIRASPEALSGNLVFISSAAHCIRLSMRRPLYLERSSAFVPLSMIAPRSLEASGVILYPLAFIFRLVIVTSSGTV